MVKVSICIGSACHVKGSRQVVEGLQYLVKQHGLQDKVELSGSFCMGRCEQPGVSVTVDGMEMSVEPNEVETFFEKEILSRAK